MKKELMCLDCGCLFVVSAKQIKKYKKKGFRVPSHCPVCRDIRWREERLKKKRANKFERKNRYEKF